MTSMIPAWENGTLQPVEKMAVHARGLRHLAVSVFVMDGDRTLLQRRALGKYHTPGLWANACCTHPAWDEAPAACARRRLAEELGIDTARLSFRDRLEYRAPVGGGMVEHEVVSIFTAEGRFRPRPDPAEVMDTRWIALDDLRAEITAAPQRFTPWLRSYVTDHAEQIFGAPA